MVKNIFLPLLLVINVFALEDLSPAKIFKATGTVQSMVFQEGKLYAGTDNGTVEVFDVDTQKRIEVIKIPDIKDFMGDTIAAKIYSIDLIKNKILIVSQGMKGYRNIFVYENKKLVKVIGIEQKLYIQKASFISSDLILFGLLSNQLGVYDMKKKQQNYLLQVSASSFSHFMISENKKLFATTDESGIVRVLNVENGQIVKQPKALNLDRVYQLDFKKGIILTAGQDRKAVVYGKNKVYSLDFDFLLYACALSPNAKLGAVAYNEKNEILVWDIDTQKYLYNLSAQEATLTQILFIDENQIVVSSDSQTINYYKLK
ncbi:WD40 repeat domain-containing protein [Poseidonibacter sp.]|uniref:WD40 repeat domain-containing protein n=1 Tax=Poseidonibacter sp. TaxID=2321188 RepID=UPI003C7665BB